MINYSNRAGQVMPYLIHYSIDSLTKKPPINIKETMQPSIMNPDKLSAKIIQEIQNADIKSYINILLKEGIRNPSELLYKIKLNPFYFEDLDVRLFINIEVRVGSGLKSTRGGITTVFHSDADPPECTCKFTITVPLYLLYNYLIVHKNIEIMHTYEFIVQLVTTKKSIDILVQDLIRRIRENIPYKVRPSTKTLKRREDESNIQYIKENMDKEIEETIIRIIEDFENSKVDFVDILDQYKTFMVYFMDNMSQPFLKMIKQYSKILKQEGVLDMFYNTLQSIYKMLVDKFIYGNVYKNASSLNWVRLIQTMLPLIQ